MGSGKTTVGRKQAGLLGREFIDIDGELIRRTGVTISHIFEVEGEEGFRDRESRLLGEICQDGQAVVSTGGGIVIRPENRALMRESGQVVYLDIPLDALWLRLRNCRNRPLLQVEDPKARMEEIKLEREPLYREAADFRVSVSSDSANRTARRIQACLAGRPAAAQ